MTPRGGTYGDFYGDGYPVDSAMAHIKCEKHQWSDWKEIGRTGDWFHPLIVERKCAKCGATEVDDR